MLARGLKVEYAAGDATVTGCDPDYVGSITLEPELMAQADLLVNEQVHVWDVSNGAGFVTYSIGGSWAQVRSR